MAHLQLLLSGCIVHTTLQNHRPESRVVEIIDMTWKYRIS
jgi:hypothetical protein